MKKNKVTEIRKSQPDEPRQLTQKEQEQLAFRTGNRRTRRKIAKRNGFFRDHSGYAWRKSNEMIRTDSNDSQL